MALATWDDLVDIGAIPGGGSRSDPQWARADGLLEKSTAQVLAHLTRVVGDTVDEDTVAGWSSTDRTIVATVVAELAGRRLTSSAAATAQQLADGYGGGYANSYLTKRDRDALAQLEVVAGGGTRSVALSTGAYSSPASWPGTWVGTVPVDEERFTW